MDPGRSGDGGRVEWQGKPVYLIKPLTYINTTGPMLLQIGRRLGFGVDECVLAHDNVDLPFGIVRVRLIGSYGGHRGVRSFRTDAIRLV